MPVRIGTKKRAKGLYYFLRWTVQTKRHERVLGYVTRAEAEEEAAKEEARLLLGLTSQTPAATCEPTVAQIVKAYMVETLRQHDRSTYALCEKRQGLRVMAHLGGLHCSRVSAAHVRGYVHDRAGQVSEHTGRPPKRRTIYAEVETLRRAYRYGKDMGLITCDPPPKPRTKTLPQDKRPMRCLREEEVAAIVEAAHQHPRDGLGWLVQLLAWSGRRPVAIFALRCCDAAHARALPRAYWTRDKGGEGTGWGPLTVPARDALVRRLAEREAQGVHPEALLFPRPRGSAYTSDTLAQVWGQVAEASGVANVQPYDLRKFACTRIYRETGNVMTTMQYTGHREAATLLRKYIYPEVEAAMVAAPQIGWTVPQLRAVGGE